MRGRKTPIFNKKKCFLSHFHPRGRVGGKTRYPHKKHFFCVRHAEGLRSKVRKHRSDSVARGTPTAPRSKQERPKNIFLYSFFQVKKLQKIYNIAKNMKQVMTFIGVFLFSFLTIAQETGELKFEETIFDFGNLPQKLGQNTTISHDFVVTNISKKPVTITKIETSCNCVVPKWTQTPILPNKKGKITVEYDASITGVFLKYIQVFTDGKPDKKTLFIQGSIEKPVPTTLPAKAKTIP